MKKYIILIVFLFPSVMFSQYFGGIGGGFNTTNANTEEWENVNLYPGSISGSQTIVEDEDPVAFVSDTPASGFGTILYQWQYSLDDVNWVDVAGETNEVFDAPVLQGLVPAPFTVYARRMAFDDNTSVASNVVYIEVQAIQYFYLEAKHSGKVFDVEAFGGIGADVQQYTALGGDNQLWRIHDAGEGYFWLEPKHAPGMCLEIGGWSTEFTGNAIIWEYLEGNNQKWYVEDGGDGYYVIKNKHSNLALDVEGILTTDGATIWQWEYVGGDNQKFAAVLYSSAKANNKQKDPLFPYLKRKDTKKSTEISVYPNPFSGEFVINHQSSSTKDLNLKIYDINGRLIDDVLFNKNKYIYNAENLNKGIYFVKVFSENEAVITKKLIKQ